MDDEKKLPASEPEDVLMQNSYPSPTTDATDPHNFYRLQLRDHDMDTDPDHLVQRALAGLAEHQEQQNNAHVHDNDHDHDLRELQALQEQDPEPQASQEGQHHELGGQHPDHQDVSVDDLRLAAQLSRDLAPMVAEAAHGHGQPQEHQQLQPQEHQQLPPQQDNAQPMQEPQGQGDQDIHQQIQDQLRSHEHDLQDIMQSAGQQNGLPAEHRYHNPVPPSAQPHGLPAMPLDSYQYPVDNTPPRKRSKVSRACDECRRKKIKCDAQADALDQPCSNCRRSSAQCLFSRVPQKRGPSKGYIKELADRINSIESKLGDSVESILEGGPRRTPTESFPSPQPLDETRKRQFSSISADAFQTPASVAARSQQLLTEHRAIRPYIPPERPWTVNDLAPPVTLPPADQLPRAEPHRLDDIPDGLPQVPPQPAERARLIDDQLFNSYLTSIHPIFPVLASSKARVQSLLSCCSPTLQDAFCDAFLEFTRPSLRSPAIINGEVTASAQQSLTRWELERHPKSLATDIVHFQTTVMMAVDHDRGRNRAAQRAPLIGKAAGVAYLLKLHQTQPEAEPGPNFDPDSDDNVALRAWWTLVAFDRWNAIGAGLPPLIHDSVTTILPGLRYIVGDAGYELIQLAVIIGDFVGQIRDSTRPIFRVGNGPEPPIFPGMSRLALRAVEQYRLHFPEVLDEVRFPHVHLAYWHTRLLADMMLADTRLESMKQDCENIARLLVTTQQHWSPLNSHFMTLVSLVLVELTKISATREVAIKTIKGMLDRGIVSSQRNAAVRDKIADTLPAPGEAGAVVGGPSSVKNLQRLADVATSDGAADTPPAPASGEAQPPAPMGEDIISPVLTAAAPLPTPLPAPPPSVSVKSEASEIEAERRAFEVLRSYLRDGYMMF